MKSQTFRLLSGLFNEEMEWNGSFTLELVSRHETTHPERANAVFLPGSCAEHWSLLVLLKTEVWGSLRAIHSSVYVNASLALLIKQNNGFILSNYCHVQVFLGGKWYRRHQYCYKKCTCCTMLHSQNPILHKDMVQPPLLNTVTY